MAQPRGGVPDGEIHICNAGQAEDIRPARELVERYGSAPLAEADVTIALGGDGFMLHCLHTALEAGVPVFGMNLGSVGF